LRAAPDGRSGAARLVASRRDHDEDRQLRRTFPVLTFVDGSTDRHVGYRKLLQ
jgi:hypothetical protein